MKDAHKGDGYGMSTEQDLELSNTKPVIWHRFQWLALAAILSLAFLLHVIPLTYSHLWDETVFLQNAMVMLDERDNYDELYYRPPVLPLLYAAGFSVWDDIFVAHLVQGGLTTLAVLFLFLFTRQSFGTAPAFFATLLFALSPYMVEASHNLLTGVPAITFMLAAMWLYGRQGILPALFTGVLFAIAVQTRFTSLFLGFYFALTVVFFHSQLRRLAWLSLGFAVTLMPYLIWNHISFGDFLHPFAHARRIVTEFNLPVPASFYLDAFTEVFPLGVRLLFVLGVLSVGIGSVKQWQANTSAPALPIASKIGKSWAGQLILLFWAIAFFVYMVSIPHKEVRYLLPLAIPVSILAGLGLSGAIQWLQRQATVLKFIGFSVVVLVLVLDLGPSLTRLTKPWVDRSQWEIVQIALFLREHSSAEDTIYAAHEFPVLAYYSERKTISLLPIQDEFEKQWRALMSEPGFLVQFHPEGVGESHSKHRTFMPDRDFLEATPSFEFVKGYSRATVYKYRPEPVGAAAKH
jgi:4-amino-4-deoxy-L-arabinose transferase-like glycosyltransferase